MKILFLTPRIPYPPLKGDQAVAYHRLRTLGPKHDVTLLTFVNGSDAPEAEDALRPFCTRIVKIPHPKWKIAWNLISRGLWSSLPLQVVYYRSLAFQKAIDELLKEDFDLIHGFMLRLLPYFQGRSKPILLECIDSMQLNMSRQVEVASGIKQWIFREELRRLKGYEPTVDKYVETAIFVSPIDAKASGAQKTLVLPLGVDIPPQIAGCRQPIIVFSGNMGYAPNVQAVEWFVRNCWENIRNAIPNATFRILGGNPALSVKAMKAVPGIEVVGRVENMMQALQETAVAVAPMQSGSGMQFKVLEAMACGLPVVATTLGLGAISAVKGGEIIVADDPYEFSEMVVQLLEDETLRKKIGDSAKKYILEHHDWGWIATEVELLYKKYSIGEVL